MSVTCSDLLFAAEQACLNASCEADWRGVCSRSYYAVFHDGKAFAESLEQDGYPGHAPAGTKPGMHHQLYTRLQHPTMPKADPRNRLSFKLGLMLKNLHSQRIKADYEPQKDVDEVTSRNSFVTAQNVLSLLGGKAVGAPLDKFTGTTTPPPVAPQKAVDPLPKVPDRGTFKIVK